MYKYTYLDANFEPLTIIIIIIEHDILSDVSHVTTDFWNRDTINTTYNKIMCYLFIRFYMILWGCFWGPVLLSRIQHIKSPLDQNYQ